MMVTGALAGPSAMSGSDTGFATSAAVAFAPWRRRPECSGAKAAKAANPTRDMAQAKAWRMTIN